MSEEPAPHGDDGFRAVGGSVKELWSEFVISFVCSCGDKVMICDAGEDETCNCGRTYRLRVAFEVKEPKGP